MPFSPPTRSWFEAAFERPTAAQTEGWAAIERGEHTLILAPTGSGKTLAAFLWALDRLLVPPPDTAERAGEGCSVLYVSPLKALTYDVERNLRAPLVGIAREAARLGVAVPDLRVATRTGDTPADERRAMLRQPPDILITTPESLYLLLTSRAASILAPVRHVIIDEIHAMAGTKRGAHLALSLERLEHLTAHPPAPPAPRGGRAGRAPGGEPGPVRAAVEPHTFQRIGLSATQRPLDELARYLGGRTPAGPARSRSSTPGCARSSACRSSCPSRTWGSSAGP